MAYLLLHNYSRRYKCPVNTFDSVTMKKSSEDLHLSCHPPTELAGAEQVTTTSYGSRYPPHQTADVVSPASTALNNVLSSFSILFSITVIPSKRKSWVGDKKPLPPLLALLD